MQRLGVYVKRSVEVRMARNRLHDRYAVVEHAVQDAQRGARGVGNNGREKFQQVRYRGAVIQMGMGDDYRVRVFLQQ